MRGPKREHRPGGLGANRKPVLDHDGARRAWLWRGEFPSDDRPPRRRAQHSPADRHRSATFSPWSRRKPRSGSRPRVCWSGVVAVAMECAHFHRERGTRRGSRRARGDREKERGETSERAHAHTPRSRPRVQHTPRRRDGDRALSTWMMASHGILSLLERFSFLENVAAGEAHSSDNGFDEKSMLMIPLCSKLFRCKRSCLKYSLTIYVIKLSMKCVIVDESLKRRKRNKYEETSLS